MIQVRPMNFFSHQILSSITKLHRRRRPALEQDNFLSAVKTVQILQFARHDLKKNFLSAPTITKLKIWQRQILSRVLDGSNKFCQSSASGPIYDNIIKGFGASDSVWWPLFNWLSWDSWLWWQFDFFHLQASSTLQKKLTEATTQKKVKLYWQISSNNWAIFNRVRW